MNFLTIHENELDTLSNYNSESTFFYSVASACASSCFTLILSAVFADKLSDTAKAICWIGIPTFAILSIAFLWLVRTVKANKKSSINRIKDESKGTYILDVPRHI